MQLIKESLIKAQHTQKCFNAFAKWTFALLALVFCFAFTGAHASVKQSLTGVVPKDVYDDYQLFLDGRRPSTISNFTGPHARRDVIEVVLIQQALARGGVTKALDFKTVETYARQLAEVSAGRAALTLTTVWQTDGLELKSTVYVSDPLVMADEFIAGIYVRPDNQKALSVQTLDQLSTLKAVSNPSWQRDWKLLQSFMPRNALYASVLWPSMVRMVDLGRVDYLLAPFQANPDMTLQFEEVVLTPIPNVKLSLNESRHVLFSNAQAGANELFSAFQTGLQEMHKLGIIRKAYRQSGFFNPSVANWSLLNPR